jgi:hypothetical protein
MLGPYPAYLSRPLTLVVLLLSGVVPCHTQSASASRESLSASPSGKNLAAERSLQAQSFASEKLWMWQKRLNLEDWNLSLVVARATDLKPRTLGNVHWDLEKKTAVIRVLDPADYRLPTTGLILRDIELTVVHELIHLEIAPALADLHRTEANRMEEEKAVNHMADALLLLDRSQ